MSSLITHEQTGISQQNRDIESNLVETLNGYLNLIRSVLDNSRTKWTDFRVVLEPRFRPIVEQSIREASTLSYQLGSSYVANKAGLPFFLTVTDIENIKQLTTEFTNKFFGRIELAINSTRGDLRIPFMEPADSRINPNYIATSIAIGVTSKSLALGSTLKAQSLVTNGRAGRMPLSSSVMQAATDKKKKRKKTATEIALEEIQDEIDAAIEEGETDLTSILINLGSSALVAAAIAELLNQRFVWVTQAGACAEICVPLAGQRWDVTDPNIPIPVQDSHVSCRCRLLLA